MNCEAIGEKVTNKKKAKITDFLLFDEEGRLHSENQRIEIIYNALNEAEKRGMERAAKHCEATELLIPIPIPGTTLKQQSANVCEALAKEIREKAERTRGMPYPSDTIEILLDEIHELAIKLSTLSDEVYKLETRLSEITPTTKG